ncbi:hypothetical protein E3P92_00063 [Wallemia ichthyophaga]|uniref:Ceramide very long chain fatty acid hydroxylase n=2 Tax=Wallemia ichthyophaga TaxID=245174 RepID=A0A4T0FZQ5_WALIC|nr:Ceramide very long chain fatty acid hydroxylase SCS7 [Wallemia ichthyophaga EXF-994]TIA76136.1 hypothetical protein E3P91_00063 [Wallemia ichthyophaga]EOR04120.1 Ceramide very long chain fatty acid hydroxylase SCS7 [Wallemia ichthyophaga EXF-994]TIA84325.1 hypothetical protein E3P98_00234 [Wallemia ichthyophaga]TIA94512.1 hypothetical protein E3P97_00063 [Wallemia ichthyophaga]TIB01823.1 hypothetical protein E3P96_02312 [Wallemia ichthyophaga]
MAELRQRRLKIHTRADVEAHKSDKSCWVTIGRLIYDVTDFLHDHPGGEDLILKYAGKDIEAAMKATNSEEDHEHTPAAFGMMSDMLIGKLDSGTRIVDENWVATDDFMPKESNIEDDLEKCEFLDLSKPLLSQVWYSNFSKDFYLEQVHQPRHLKKSARLFGYDFLEMFTVTPWYVIPLIWVPITLYLSFRSFSDFSTQFGSSLGGLCTLGCFLLGNVIWTILEYGMHRFLFHVDDYLPDRPVFLMLHFLLHGIHHYLPADGLRLVMPPTLFTALQYPFTQLAYKILPNTATANGVISGSFAFYVLYDCMHYALHHTRLPNYLKQMKSYHLKHHYGNFELGFGVTSKFWDLVFKTELK